MKFGLSGAVGGLEACPVDDTLRLSREVERLGFDCMWFNEEHFSRAGGAKERPILSPVVAAMAVAAATTTLRVGFSVLLVPLHHPLRLAEELATLDTLSGGRVNLGVSRAAGPRYADPFGYDPERDPSLAECLDTMIGYWAGKPLLVDGQEQRVSPDVVQRPHPPVFVGAYSEETITWAAGREYPIMVHGIQSPASMERCLGSFAAHGGDISSVPVGRFCYVGETDAQARRDAWDVAVRQAERLHTIGIWRRGRGITTEADLDPERFYNETAIIGGPETVARRIADLRDRLGVTYVNLLPSFFGMLPPHLLLQSLTRFSTEVMPRLGPVARSEPSEIRRTESAPAAAVSP